MMCEGDTVQGLNREETMVVWKAVRLVSPPSQEQILADWADQEEE